MRYLAIFELILVSLGLIGFSLYLFFADTGGDINNSPMMRAVRSGSLNTVSLAVVDKYATDGKKKLYYVILSDGKHQSDITRAVPKATYNAIAQGDQYFGYDFGSDYMIPAIDGSQKDASWRLYAGVMAGFFAFAFVLTAYKIYKRGKLKDMIKFEMQYQLSGF